LIGERIAKARKKAGYSDQKSFSAELIKNGFKVSPRTLADYELNNTEPKISTVREIAKICNVSFNWLIDGIGDAELTSSGVSNYNHEESIDNAEKMYRELSIEDKQIVYAVIKRLHQTSSALDDAVDKAFGE